MTLNLRRTKKYHPRRSSKLIKSNKKRLSEMEHTLQSGIEALLASMREGGNPNNTQALSQRVKEEFLRVGPEMQEIANELGGTFPKKVAVFLSSVDAMLHAKQENTQGSTLWVDNSKLQSCFKATKSLEQALLK